MDITPIDIYLTAKENPDLFGDLIGIARKVASCVNPEVSCVAVSYFLLNYDQMWHVVGNADYFIRDRNNPNLTPLDCLLTFKEYTREMAYRENTGSQEGNWYEAQSKISSIIKEKLSRKWHFKIDV